MKVQIKVNPTTIVEVEGKNIKEVMEALAEAEEVFAVSKCGLCGKEGVRHQVRHVDKWVYYELACTNSDCRAKFSFGQTKEGKLFPQRKTKDGDWKPNGGWERYERAEG